MNLCLLQNTVYTFIFLKKSMFYRRFYCKHFIVQYLFPSLHQRWRYMAQMYKFIQSIQEFAQVVTLSINGHAECGIRAIYTHFQIAKNDRKHTKSHSLSFLFTNIKLDSRYICMVSKCNSINCNSINWKYALIAFLFYIYTSNF